MKKILCLTFLLCLAACIQVKNLGCYGQNLSHDGRLHGAWVEEKVGSGQQAFEIWPYLTGYIVVPHQPKSKEVSKDKSDIFWTMKINGYDFMLIGGLLYRYEFAGHKLKMFELDTEGHFEEIGELVATAKNIKLERIKSELAQLTYTTLNIEHMDAAAAVVLVELAARPELWKQTLNARRLAE